MKSVGEVMAIGRTFKESFQKALRSMELGYFGLGLGTKDEWYSPNPPSRDEIVKRLSTPTPDRLHAIRYAFLSGMSVDEVAERSFIDPWFLDNIYELVEFEKVLVGYKRHTDVPKETLRQAKEWGYSDRQLSWIWQCSELEFRKYRKNLGIDATFDWSTRVPPSSKHTHHTTIQRTTAKTRSRNQRTVDGS